MNFDAKRLYELLPTVFRIRDTMLAQQANEQNLSPEEIAQLEGPLKALLSIIADEVGAIEENIDQLYDDQFIETCANWVVPYIGALVGTKPLLEIPNSNFSTRSEVANTIKYRRRKGTASVIEQLARDLTGWDANVVEYFQLLAVTQYLNHLRPHSLATSDLRNRHALEYVNTPFDKLPKTVDVRRIESHRGKYNIQNIGIFLWRVQAYPVTRLPAYQVDALRYSFDVLGRDIPLYQRPTAEANITQLAQATNVPMPISRAVLAQDLERQYGTSAANSIVVYVNDEVFSLENVDLLLDPAILAAEPSLKDIICVCNLSDITDGGGVVIGWANMPTNKLAIDPVLGRLALPPTWQNPPEVRNIHVSYHYGFTADLGGGEYNRQASLGASMGQLIQVQNGTGIQAALDQLANTGGTLEIIDNERYEEDLTINLNTAAIRIEIRAADGVRPTLILNNPIQINAQNDTEVLLNGLLISGNGIEVPANSELNSLQIKHCSITPSDSPLVSCTIASLLTNLILERSIVGMLRVVEGASTSIKDCIIDATDTTAVAYSGLMPPETGGKLHIENSTVIGEVYAQQITLASNTIFLSTVVAQQLQTGCVRFSYFPDDSIMPRPFRCQAALSGDFERVKPIFTSLTYGDAAYCQLGEHCVSEITQGADDESEMGVLHHLYQAHKVANLRSRLNEYLGFGMEAGIFYAS